jgi:hypothetical protein
MASKEVQQALANRRRAAVTAMFDYYFLVKYERPASYWEARLGEALANGEISVNQIPTAIGLRQVHLVAAEVADALTTSEVAIVNAPEG